MHACVQAGNPDHKPLNQSGCKLPDRKPFKPIRCLGETSQTLWLGKKPNWFTQWTHWYKASFNADSINTEREFSEMGNLYLFMWMAMLWFLIALWTCPASDIKPQAIYSQSGNVHSGCMWLSFIIRENLTSLEHVNHLLNHSGSVYQTQTHCTDNQRFINYGNVYKLGISS